MKKIFFTLMLSIVLMPQSLLAARFEADNQTAFQEPINEDIYTAGETVELNTTVNGDFFGAGQNVRLNGEISEDVLAAGNNIVISAPVKDDVRAMGQTVEISSSVEGDVLVAGQTLTLSKNSSVNGDVLFAGQSLSLNGMVKGSVKGVGQKVYLNGTVDGNMTLYKETDIEFGPEAKITGNLTYSYFEEKTIPEGVVGGKVVFQKLEQHDKEEIAKGIAGFSIYWLLATLFFGVIAIGFMRMGVVHNAQRAEDHMLTNLGIGFLCLIAPPIAAIIFMITLIGIPFGLFLLTLWMVALFVCKVFAGMLIGKRLIKVNEASSFLRIFGSFALGTLIFLLIGLIPIFGGILCFLILLITLGGLFLAMKDRFIELRKKKLV